MFEMSDEKVVLKRFSFRKSFSLQRLDVFIQEVVNLNYLIFRVLQC